MARAWLPALMMLGLASCGDAQESYDGPGEDHPLVGRSAAEIHSCGAQECLAAAGEQQVVQVVWEDGPAVADTACLPGRLQVAIESGEIVAAHDSGC